MTGWLHYIEEMAYWYVMFFENKDNLMITAVPLVVEDAMKIPFDFKGVDVVFHLLKIKGDTFAKIQEIQK